MIGRVVANLLGRVLGTFVEPLSWSQIETKMYEGAFGVNDVAIKKGGRISSRLPFEIKGGLIKRLEGNLEWGSMGPSCLALRNVIVIIGLAGDAATGVAAGDHDLSNVTERLASIGKTEIENLCVRLEMRIDSSVTEIGVKIAKLTIGKSDDETKRIEMQGFGLYVDNGTCEVDMADFDGETKEPDHTWVLEKLGVVVVVKKEESFDVVDVIVDEVLASLSIEQFDSLTHIFSGFGADDRTSVSRPSRSAKGACWLEYVHGRTFRKSVDIKQMLKMLRLRKEPMYTREDVAGLLGGMKMAITKFMNDFVADGDSTSGIQVRVKVPRIRLAVRSAATKMALKFGGICCQFGPAKEVNAVVERLIAGATINEGTTTDLFMKLTRSPGEEIMNIDVSPPLMKIDENQLTLGLQILSKCGFLVDVAALYMLHCLGETPVSVSVRPWKIDMDYNGKSDSWFKCGGVTGTGTKGSPLTLCMEMSEWNFDGAVMKIEQLNGEVASEGSTFHIELMEASNVGLLSRIVKVWPYANSLVTTRIKLIRCLAEPMELHDLEWVPNGKLTISAVSAGSERKIVSSSRIEVMEESDGYYITVCGCHAVLKWESCFDYAAEFAATLPKLSAIHVNMSDFCVIMPAMTTDSCEFAIVARGDAEMIVTWDKLKYAVSKLTLEVKSNRTDAVAVPILDEFNVSLSAWRTAQGFDVKVAASDFSSVVSPSDMFLLREAVRGVRESFPSLSEVYRRWARLRSRMKTIRMKTGEFSFLLCERRINVEKVTPLFRIVVGAMNRDKIEWSVFATEICIGVQHYNVAIGGWDVLLEKMRMTVVAMTSTHDTMHVHVENCNLNLSITALQNMHSFWVKFYNRREITNEKTLTDVWLCNRVAEELNVRCGELNFSASRGDVVPLVGVHVEDEIEISIHGKDILMTPNTIMYTTMLTPFMSVSLGTHNGSLLLVFNSSVQIENRFPITLRLFEVVNKEVLEIALLRPDDRYPLHFRSTKARDFIVTQRETAGGSAKTMHIDPCSSDETRYRIDGEIDCVKTSYIDGPIASRVFALISPVVFKNGLPMDIYMKYTMKEEATKVTAGGSTSLLYHAKDAWTFRAGFSLTEDVSLKSGLVMPDLTSTRIVSVASPRTDEQFQSVLTWYDSPGTNQLVIELSCPVVFHNLYDRSLTVKDSCSSYSQTITPGSTSLWCSPSAATGGLRLIVDLSVPDFTLVVSEAFDCAQFGETVVLLPILKSPRNLVNVPLICHSELMNETYVVTFSSLLYIVNELEFDLTVSPTLSELVSEPIADTVMVRGGGGRCRLDGVSIDCSAVVMVMDHLPSRGVVLSRDGSSVFTLTRGSEILQVELVIDTTPSGITATFRRVVSVVPLVMTNDTDVSMTVRTDREEREFTVVPRSSLIFPADSPFGAQFVVVKLGDIHFTAAIDDETSALNTERKLDDKPIFFAVKKLTRYTRIVLVAEESGLYQCVPISRLLVSVGKLSIALIDKRMHELADIQITGFLRETSLMSDDTRVLKLTVASVHVEDGNPRSVSPVVFRGEGGVFFMGNVIYKPMPSDMNHVKYAYMAFGMTVVNVDAAFLTDLLSFVSDVRRYIVLGRLGDMKLDVDWMEVSPIRFDITYQDRATRGTSNALIDPTVRILPALTSLPVSANGYVVNDFSGSLSSLESVLLSFSIVDITEAVVGHFKKGNKERQAVQRAAAQLRLRTACRIIDQSKGSEIVGLFREGYLMDKLHLIDLCQVRESVVFGAFKGSDATGEVSIAQYQTFASYKSFQVCALQLQNVNMLSDGPVTKRRKLSFADNRISEHNTDISNAQETLRKAGFVDEYICMYDWCTLTNKYVCVTERFAFILSPKLTEILCEVFISHISRLECIGSEVHIRGRRDTEQLKFKCSGADKATRIKTFITSQKYMISILGDSERH